VGSSWRIGDHVAGSEDFWEDILGHLRQRVLIPIVGPDLLVLKDAPGRTLSRVLGEKLAARYQLGDALAGQGLGEAVRAVLATKRDTERLYRVVNDLLAALDPVAGESLEKLAAITDLRLFVSTTFDGLLARTLDAVRFGGERRTRELWFSPSQSTAEQQRNAIAPSGDDAVVFKLFGQASSMPQYALHDEDILEWLHALVAETARLPEWLNHQLKENPLLFLGCQIPDWIGRFLMRLGSPTRLSLAQKQFFIVGSGISAQLQLTDFLRTYCGTTRVQVLDADPGEVVAELHRRWVQHAPRPAPGAPGAEPPSVGGSIFISYAREDVEAARRLHAALASLGGDVWLDERRLEPGERWQDEILAGIRRQVRMFLPLISRHTESRQEGYVFDEWQEAIKRARRFLNRRFIVPIVVDTDYEGNPGRYRQVPEEFRELHFGRAPGGEPAPDLVAALTQEIRAMRRAEPA